MYALYDDERQSLIRCSIMLVCGGLLVLPLTVPPNSPLVRAEAVTHRSRLSVPDVPGKLAFPEIAVQKDPFVPEVSILTPAAANSSVDAAAITQGQDIGIVLPANAGASGTLPQFGAPPSDGVVRGIVLGNQSQALIDSGNGVKVFAIGDRIGEATIRNIDASGVTLSSGIVLKIARSQP